VVDDRSGGGGLCCWSSDVRAIVPGSDQPSYPKSYKDGSSNEVPFIRIERTQQNKSVTRSRERELDLQHSANRLSGNWVAIHSLKARSVRPVTPIRNLYLGRYLHSKAAPLVPPVLGFLGDDSHVSFYWRVQLALSESRGRG
jgi:hypothetical protein